MAKTRADRNRRYREGVARRGGVNFGAVVDRATAARLRGLAREHGEPLGEVLKLASLLAVRELSSTTQTGSAE
ncbi:MAG: hypothetical protein JSR41_05150 [Proteobacteria bacterium]|nr:hypothetical protein [Pseudomonadota bacterium]